MPSRSHQQLIYEPLLLILDLCRTLYIAIDKMGPSALPFYDINSPKYYYSLCTSVHEVRATPQMNAYVTTIIHKDYL